MVRNERRDQGRDEGRDEGRDSDRDEDHAPGASGNHAWGETLWQVR